MDIKLVAFDMDGTLLNSRHELSPETIRALYKLKEKGIICVICTGRSIAGLKHYSELLDLNMPIVTLNGTIILDKDKNVIFARTLTSEDAKRIWSLADNLNANLAFWSNNKLYCNKINKFTLNYSERSYLPITLIDDFEAFVQDNGISKMIFFDQEDKIIDFKSKVSKIKDFNVNYCISNQYMLEFFNIQVSKANALDFLGKYYNITPEQMMAFGDGENDIDMLEYVGYGVVMQNALESVKSHGKFITKTNDEDGVAYALKKFIRL